MHKCTGWGAGLGNLRSNYCSNGTMHIVWGEEEKKEGGVVHAQGLLLEQLLLNVQGPINERWTRDQPGGKVPSL